MSRYWPVGVELADIQSPLEILEEAKADWDSNSGGQLTLILQKVQTRNNNDMIVVHAQHVPTNRTSSLFSVIHRPGSPYPVTIQPRDSEIPNFLKKEYYDPGSPGYKDIGSIGSLAMNRVMAGTPGHTVQNHWVSEKPSEFRMKLQEAFNLGIVTSEVLNLISVKVSEVGELSSPATGTDESGPDASHEN